MKHILNQRLFEETGVPFTLELIHDAMTVQQRQLGLTVNELEKHLSELDMLIEESGYKVSLQTSLKNVVNLAKQYITPENMVFMPEHYISTSYATSYLLKSKKTLLFDKSYDMGTRSWTETDWNKWNKWKDSAPRITKTEKLVAEESVVLYDTPVIKCIKWDFVDLFNFEDEEEIDMEDNYAEYAPYDLRYYVADYRLINAFKFAGNLSNHSTTARNFLLNKLRHHSKEEMVRITLFLANVDKDAYYLHRHNKLDSVYDELEQLDFLKDIELDDFVEIRSFLGINN